MRVPAGTHPRVPPPSPAPTLPSNCAATCNCNTNYEGSTCSRTEKCQKSIILIFLRKLIFGPISWHFFLFRYLVTPTTEDVSTEQRAQTRKLPAVEDGPLSKFQSESKKPEVSWKTPVRNRVEHVDRARAPVHPPGTKTLAKIKSTRKISETNNL